MTKSGRTDLKDIAEVAQVAVSTVSLVLGGRGREVRIRADTIDRIVTIARALQYSKHVAIETKEDMAKEIFSWLERNELVWLSKEELFQIWQERK